MAWKKYLQFSENSMSLSSHSELMLEAEAEGISSCCSLERLWVVSEY